MLNKKPLFYSVKDVLSVKRNIKKGKWETPLCTTNWERLTKNLNLKKAKK